MSAGVLHVEVVVIVLGLLLLLASGAVALGVVLSNTGPASVDALGVTVSNITLGGLFIAGAVTGLVFMLGVVATLAGTSRSRQRRMTVKHVRSTRSENQQLAEENATLRSRLEGEPYPADPTSESETTTDESPKRKGIFNR